MPPALRHAVTTVLKKYQHLDQNPSPASYSSLSKPYEALKSLWAELQWELYETDLQTLEASVRQQQAERPLRVQQKLSELRESYVRNFQQRRQRLTERKQRLEQKKQELRNSMTATRNELAEKSRLLSLNSEQLIAQQLLRYESEWTSAEQRIETQQQQLQQHKQTLRDAFNKLQLSLSEQPPTVPQRLKQLQLQSAQYRSALPGLVATWKNAATERETRLREELASWNAKYPMLSDGLPTWNDLQTSWQQLNDYRQSLNEWNQQLQQRKQRRADHARRVAAREHEAELLGAAEQRATAGLVAEIAAVKGIIERTTPTYDALRAAKIRAIDRRFARR